jgi:hypothetical protein
MFSSVHTIQASFGPTDVAGVTEQLEDAFGSLLLFFDAFRAHLSVFDTADDLKF